MTGREVPEWIGKTDDAAAPPRVRLRVFERCGGMCHISGIRIRAGDAWELDHVKALCNGGENRESNLAPALAEKHKAKTALDVAEKSRDRRIKQKHLGMRPANKWKTPVPGSRASPFKKKLDGTVVRRDRS
jgi:5-methylcytosine-specific restriction endonuclease McrA